MQNPHHSPPDAVEREPATRSGASQERGQREPATRSGASQQRAAGAGPEPEPERAFHGRAAPGREEGFHAAGGEDWRSRYGASPPPRSPADFSALLVLLDTLRQAAPAELQGRLTGLIREALLTLRSLIDWYLDRLERPPPEPRVEEIPID